MASPANYISQAKVGSTTYDLYALGLNNAGTFYDSQELLNMITGAGFEPKVTTSLPAADASAYATYKNTIVFVGETKPDGSANDYDEYVIMKDGNNYSWEVVGHTGVQIEGLKTIANQTGTPSTDATGSAGSATIQGSNFSFSGTSATITVPAHSHTLGGTTKYLQEVTAPKTFSSTSVLTSLATTSVVSAGEAVNVVTGYNSPASSNFVDSVSNTVTRYKTQSITPVNGSETVATAGDAVTVATEGITGYASPTKAGLATTSISYNTDAIKSYPGAFAALATTSIRPAADVTALTSVTASTSSIYPAANVTALTSVTASTGSIYPAANVTAVTSISYATITVTNGVLEFPQINYGYQNDSAAVRDSAATVVTGVSVAAGKSVRDTAATVVTDVDVAAGKSVQGTAVTVATGGTTTGSQIMTGLGTAVAATKATTTVATGGTTTGTQFLTGLGAATAAGTASITPVGGTVSVAKAGTAVTVITGSTTTTGGVAVVSSITNTTAAALTGLGTASTESVAKAGTEITVVTGANGTTNAYTGVASNVTAVNITTTAGSNQAFIASLNANSGEKAAEDIAYTPAGSIGGSQSISAHTHSLSAHTHSIPALSITVPTT